MFSDQTFPLISPLRRALWCCALFLWLMVAWIAAVPPGAQSADPPSRSAWEEWDVSCVDCNIWFSYPSGDLIAKSHFIHYQDSAWSWTQRLSGSSLFSLYSGSPESVHLRYYLKGWPGGRPFSRQHRIGMADQWETVDVDRMEMRIFYDSRASWAALRRQPPPVIFADNTWVFWSCHPSGDCKPGIRHPNGRVELGRGDIFSDSCQPVLHLDQRERVHTVFASRPQRCPNEYHWGDGTSWQNGPSIPGTAIAMTDWSETLHVVYYTTENLGNTDEQIFWHGFLMGDTWSVIPLHTGNRTSVAAVHATGTDAAAVLFHHFGGPLYYSLSVRQGDTVSQKTLDVDGSAPPAFVTAANRVWVAGVANPEEGVNTLELIRWDGT